MATGEMWPGLEAKDLGLVDSVSTLDEYVTATWGMRTYDFGPSVQGLQLLNRTLQDADELARGGCFIVPITHKTPILRSLGPRRRSQLAPRVVRLHAYFLTSRR